jgi:hypothetical protein
MQNEADKNSKVIGANHSQVGANQKEGGALCF